MQSTKLSLNFSLSYTAEYSVMVRKKLLNTKLPYDIYYPPKRNKVYGNYRKKLLNQK